jgi:hypothetical protein
MDILHDNHLLHSMQNCFKRKAMRANEEAITERPKFTRGNHLPRRSAHAESD